MRKMQRERTNRMTIEHFKSYEVRFYDSQRAQRIAMKKLRVAGWTYIFDYIDRQGPALSIGKTCGCGCLKKSEG